MANWSWNASTDHDFAHVNSGMRPCLYLDEVWSAEHKVWITNIILIVVNCLSCLPAVMGNLLVLLAVWRTPALHNPSNALLCCLALSDFLVGAVVQPSFIAQNVFEMHRNFGAYCVARLVTDFLTWTCAGASFLTMCAIAVERVLALVFHLRYRTMVTIKGVKMVFAVFWFVCITLVVSRFFGVNRQNLTTIPIAVLLSCITIIISCYVKIFQVIRRLQRNSSYQLDGMHRANITGYKKFTITTLYVVLIFLICYVPFIVAMISFVSLGNTMEVKLAYNYITTLIYLNSSFNAFVYCLRIRSVRKAVLGLLKSCKTEPKRRARAIICPPTPETLARVIINPPPRPIVV